LPTFNKCYNSAGGLPDRQANHREIRPALLPKRSSAACQQGDVLHLIETPTGIELTPYDPEFAEQIAVAEEVMRSDRNVLKKLAE
jgi:hypothetical protein